jgi:HlyD family secretion protein
VQANEVSARHNSETATFSLERQISAAESEISLLKGQLQQTGSVVSPYAGRVMEVLVDEGQLLAPGTKIATVELADSTLGAVIFVPGAGRRPEPGMIARILPSNVHWEESGFLEGEITYVSQTPVSMAGAMRYVKNEELAQALLAGGNPYAVEVRFHRDPTTASGYRWTSGSGPDLQVTSGMLASAQIDVARQRPISLVIPALRRLLGI